MRILVIINEQHSLFPEQKEILNKRFPGWEFLNVPASGWNKKEREEIIEKELDGNRVIFASPIPGMISRCSRSVGLWNAGDLNFAPDTIRIHECLVFSNDTREKKELPGGKIIQVVASTGWYLE